MLWTHPAWPANNSAYLGNKQQLIAVRALEDSSIDDRLDTLDQHMGRALVCSRSSETQPHTT